MARCGAGRARRGSRQRLLTIVCACFSACSPAHEDAGDVADPSAPDLPAFDRPQAELFSASGAQPNAWADYDNDGDLDLYVGFRGRESRLYRNDLGTFVDVAAAVGLAAQPTPTAETRAAA